MAKIRTGPIQELVSLADADLVGRLYLRVLGRKPTPAELKIGLQHLKKAEARTVAFEDLVWALVNSREFIANH
jgi:hypothetical protein